MPSKLRPDNIHHSNKYCTTCNQVKLKTGFANNKSNKDGLQNTCRMCMSEYSRNRNKVKKAQKVPINGTRPAQDLTAQIALLESLGKKYLEAARQLEAIQRLTHETVAGLKV